jgi:hypothetical protein
MLLNGLSKAQESRRPLLTRAAFFVLSDHFADFDQFPQHDIDLLDAETSDPGLDHNFEPAVGLVSVL